MSAPTRSASAHISECIRGVHGVASMHLRYHVSSATNSNGYRAVFVNNEVAAMFWRIGVDVGAPSAVQDKLRDEHAALFAGALAMKAALQWLLDDMHDAGETHNNQTCAFGTVAPGAIFDSVECAAKALVAVGGKLAWYPPKQGGES